MNRKTEHEMSRNAANRVVPPPPFRRDQREMLVEQSTTILACVTAMSQGMKIDLGLLATTIRRVGSWGWIRDIIICVLLVLILMFGVYRANVADSRPVCVIPDNAMVSMPA